MQNDTLPTPQAAPIADPRADVAPLAELAARLTTLERSARRWRMAFGAMALCVFGMGANAAVNDATFGTVKATAFEVIDSKGTTIGSFHISSDNGKESTALMVTESAKKKAILLTPGKNPLVVDNE